MFLQKLGRRHLVVAMISLCYMLNFIVRVSFPLTLIQMVQTPEESESEDFEFTCSNIGGNRSRQTGSKLNTLPFTSLGTAEQPAAFDWDNTIIGHLLSAYGMGHILGNLTGGLFCSLIGGKKVHCNCPDFVRYFTVGQSNRS